MNTDSTVSDINTFEELTLHALDRTAQGLKELCEQSRACANALEANLAGSGPAIASLAQNLHDFDVFEFELITMFQLDRDSLGDAGGNLKSVQDAFHDNLNALSEKITTGDWNGLALILRTDLPNSLQRYQELIPIIREHIYVEYVQNGNCA
ncbi:MAG: hypothetical protein HY343_02995 [Lentisphaerae bacterium]|nr:hypothetical protein [Lentisphaerota bacterium]